MENAQQPNGTKDIKQAYRTAYLIAGFLKQTLTIEEKEELDCWITVSDENMILFEKMTDEKNIAQAGEWFKKMNVEEDLQETKQRIRNRKPLRLLPFTITAAVIILLAIGVYIFYNNSNNKTNKVVAADKQDITPGSSVATLTLDKGEKIVLDNKGTDTTLNKQIRLLRKDGKLVYSNTSSQKELVYNTLAVPRKGQYKLVLPDGSKVWLNSESSIRYPIAFTSNERKVFVTGETYFEVAHDENKPFYVVANDVLLEDIGTEFNVNAYNNEPYFAATLVEGSVKITKGLKSSIVKPGEQAQLSNNDLKIIATDANDVTAWKNNEFKFSGTSINEIMRQVQRWYDADVEFKDNVSMHLNATIERDVPVSKLLNILEETGQVHFEIKDNKIIVMK